MNSLQQRLHQHRRRRRLRWLLRFVLCALVLFAVVQGWRRLHSPQLAFGRITIHGSSLLTEQDVLTFGGTQEPCNLFNLDRGRLEDALRHDIRFKSEEVRYSFPDELIVTVAEREPALYVANSYHSYLRLDYNGMVLNVTTTIPDAKAPVMVGAKCGNVYIGDNIVNKDVLAVLRFLQQLTPEAREQIGEIGLDDRHEIKLRLTGRLPILLGSTQELQDKAALFMTVYDEIKNKEIKAEYIDLTFAKPYIKLLPEQQNG